MEKNKVRAFKDVIFKRLNFLEKAFAYNRTRRNRWIAQMSSIIPKNSRVLDVGAGGCPHRMKFDHCYYFAHDFAQLSETQIQDQSGYGKLDYVSDILSIPVSDESFDVVLCTEVLEHVPYPIETIQELSRILKSGGTILLTAPLQSGLHQEPYHFYGGYTKYWYREFLTKNGFIDIEIEPNGTLHTTYFASGLTILKLFLEELFNSSSVLRKAVALISLILFAPILLIFNTIFCFLWENIFKVDSFTAGYHVKAKKL